MPIRKFCDICDNLIPTKYEGTVSSNDKHWSVSISTHRNDEEYDSYRDQINVHDGNGKYAGQIPINITHSYVCETCVTAIRKAMYQLTPKYKDTPTCNG